MKSFYFQVNFALPARAICRLFIGCLLLSVSALSQTPSASPVLRLETGMHTAIIRRIGTDAANRWLVTASDDKTARVWDLQTGELLRVLRPPIGAGDAGKLYAVAVSPNGRTVAVGGYTRKQDQEGNAESIYLFDRESGRIVRRIGSLPKGVFHLAFSPDGRFLVAALGGKNGVRIYETKNFGLAGQDADYGDSSYGADFDPNSRRLVTSCYDGYLRLYEVGAGDLKLIAKRAAAGGKRSYSVKFSPDGGKIAVGFDDSTNINVLSASDLSLQFAPDITGVNNGDLFSVAWSSDGGTLFAGGSYYANGSYPIRFWSDGGRGRWRDTEAANNTILDIQPLRTGGAVFGAVDPAWGAIDAGGKRTRFITPVVADYRALLEHFLLSNDGGEIAFGYEVFGKSPARFSLAERRLQIGENNSRTLNAPRTTGISVTDWKDTTEPKLNGGKLALDNYEISRSLAVAADNSKFLLGTEYWIRMFDRTGKELWKTAIPGVAWSVNISNDGRTAAAAFGDGTIRWYRITDGKELLAFFPHADKKRWVLWTPTGYYDASPDAEELIGWHVNNGKDAAADFFPVGQFRSQFYRPDVIDLVLKTLDETTALQQANDAAGRKQQTADISKQLPPVIEIVSPRDGTEVSNSLVKIGYNIRTSSGEPVTNLKILVDGRPVAQDRGAGNRPTGGAAEITVTIPEKDSEVAIIAENRFAPSVPAVVKLKWKGKTANADEFVVKPKLYILAIGVSKYANADYNLGYAAKDAKDFAAAMQAQQGGIYREVVVKTLTDADATRDNIVDGLDWIRLQTTSKDVAMIFMAGHGTNDTLNRYYFLPHNFNADRLASTGVTFTDIKNSVEAIAGKAVFFVDTCHSGNVLGTTKSRGLPDINGFVNELSSAENGAIVFAASTGKQVSLEDDSWNNGAFTKALVEGLSGKAQIPGKGKITINSLDLYISERVKELTRGQQTPTTTKPNTVPDFPVAAAKY